MSLRCLQPFRCTDNSRSDIGESDFTAKTATAPSVTRLYPLLFCCCTVHFFFHQRTCLCYKTLTHLCQIKSNHPCCLRCSIFTIYRLLFNFHLCPKPAVQKATKQRENTLSRGIKHELCCHGCRHLGEYEDDALRYGGGCRVTPPAGEVIRMTQYFPTVTPTLTRQIIHQLVEMCQRWSSCWV